MSPTFGSLFAGIGGLDLGLERAGWEPIWQVENDPFCNNVLKKHWPEVKRYGDIKEIDWSEVERPDLICGGFPCQNISSVSVNRTGLEGEHSGLWERFARAIRVVRPRYVLVENVPSVLVRGMGTVLEDLADERYDAEWFGIPASAVGAPHLRARQWILAYSRSVGNRLEKKALLAGGQTPELCSWWASEPDVGRVAHGIPNRVDRLRALGNAVVPQVAEWIGRRILETRNETQRAMEDDSNPAV